MDKLSRKNHKRVRVFEHACITTLRLLTSQPAEADLMPRTIKRKSKKQAATAVPDEAPAVNIDETTFPFLQLPGEIRNIIYTYALVDTSYSIRLEANISKRDGRCIVRRLYRARPSDPDRDDLPGQTKGSITKPSHSFKEEDPVRRSSQSSFGVNMFQVCRQINVEAAPIFYGKNLFAFEAVPHMYAFLVHFHHRLPLMRKLGLASMTANPTIYRGPQFMASMPLSTVFPLLANAVNLEALYLSVSVLQLLSGRGYIAARTLFQQGFSWMFALRLKSGDRLAVLDVIKLPALSATASGSAGPRWAVDAGKQGEFTRELAGRLTAE